MKIWEESCEQKKKKKIYNFGAIAHEVKKLNLPTLWCPKDDNKGRHNVRREEQHKIEKKNLNNAWFQKYLFTAYLKLCVVSFLGTCIRCYTKIRRLPKPTKACLWRLSDRLPRSLFGATKMTAPFSSKFSWINESSLD